MDLRKHHAGRGASMSSSGWLVSSDMAHGFSLFYGKPPVCALRELLRFSNGQDGHYGRTDSDRPRWVLLPSRLLRSWVPAVETATRWQQQQLHRNPWMGRKTNTNTVQQIFPLLNAAMTTPSYIWFDELLRGAFPGPCPFLLQTSRR